MTRVDKKSIVVKKNPLDFMDVHYECSWVGFVNFSKEIEGFIFFLPKSKKDKKKENKETTPLITKIICSKLFVTIVSRS